ncbi:MAG TPA: AAA family ATPase [Thermoanaerobacterales bacterium]|nr:AAA family ATPase [Thermoanaerobacterales bacterium]
MYNFLNQWRCSKISNNLNEIIDEFFQALYIEIKNLKEVGGKKIRIFDGRFLAKLENEWVYIFGMDVELFLPDSTPVRIEIDDRKYYGEVISCENFEIMIALKDKILESVAYVDMYCEPWKILEALQARLIEIKKGNHIRNVELALKTVNESRNRYLITNGKLNRGQNSAIKMALNQPVTFIWGPPGTGKTHSLAKIALRFLKKSNKVLIISQSNIAVDGAIFKISILGNDFLKPGNVIRYGYPKMEEIRNSDLTSFNLTLQKYPLLNIKKEALEKRRDILKNKKNSQEWISLEKDLASLRQEIKKYEYEIVKEAKIVATTISKATIDSIIFEDSYDVVIMDEASMAYIPQAFYAASLAKKHAIFLGDFRQLPPIALSDGALVRKWLLRDIFEEAKVKESVETRQYHPWMSLLNVQRRMHPKISGFINVNIYGGLLEDHEEVIENTQHIIDRRPFRGEVISLLNLTRFPAFCCQDSSRSRYNILSAFISVQLALQAVSDGQKSVGVITPYATQSRFVRSILMDIFRGRPLNKIPVTAATVHQFQGSEKDIIIFDCVDSYRQTRPGVLLTGQDLDKAMRLINVAVSRARGKFIGVAHKGFWDNRLNKNDMLNKMFVYLKEKGKYIFEEEIVEILKESIADRLPNVPRWFYREDYVDILLKDFKEAKKEIYIDVPHGELVENVDWWDEVLKSSKKGILVNIRCESVEDIPTKLRHIAREASFIWSPITIIDQNIIWYGHPMKTMEKVEYMPIMRFEGQKTARMLVSMLEMARSMAKSHEHAMNLHNTLATFIADHLKCPKCGSPFKLRRGRNNRPFLGCSSYPNCMQTMLVPEEVVNAYLASTKKTCPDCGYPFEAKAGKYGLFISCMGFPKCKNTLSIWEI